MSRWRVWLIRILEVALVAIVATLLEEKSVSIVGGLLLGVLWSYNDRALNDKKD